MNSAFKLIFKAYDVRGLYPKQINGPVIRRIGHAYAQINKPKTVAIGQDVRAHGLELKKQLIDALLESGVDVVDIGIITTDQLYFAVGEYGYDGGISVTASHNPAEYNGLKFCQAGGEPIDSKNLEAIRDWSGSDSAVTKNARGTISQKDILDAYVKRVLTYADIDSIKSLTVIANANFGAVGRSVNLIADRLGLELKTINWQEDGSFPKGAPNPLLPENRDETISLIKKNKPDFGVAWDADADRVFFFTGNGQFVPSCFIIALLAPVFLNKYSGSSIVHDLTTAWVIDDAINAAGGKPVANRTGHTFIKARMRELDAPFAGESSGHYYFRDSFYADNGIVPFLMILEMISRTGKTLDELVGPLMQQYKVSGEINFSVKDAARAEKAIEDKFGKQGKIDRTDGLVVESKAWRFSVRSSNTEPLLRLNAESKNQEILDTLVTEISTLILNQSK